MQILGFEEKELTGKNIYVSENSYNLQKSNYIYVHLPKIKQETMAVININNNKNVKYESDFDYIKLNSLNVEIKDENDNIIDFCNLSYKLEFKLYFSNEDLKIDDIQNLNDVLDSDESEEIKSIDSDNVVSNNILEY